MICNKMKMCNFVSEELKEEEEGRHRMSVTCGAISVRKW